MSDRPRVGISACLLGEPVRHDAGHKRDVWLADVLGPRVDWVPVCPEVEAGFGTPRETMHLVRTEANGVALITTTTARDVTDTMCACAGRRVDELARADLDGYVLKADSPSCGVDGVRVFTSPSAAECTGRGLFAEALIARLPDLPVADERRLSDQRVRQQFVERVFAHHRTRRMRE